MTIWEAVKNDSLNGDIILSVTDRALNVSGRGWIPKSIISDADYLGTYKRLVGKAQGYVPEQNIIVHRYEVEIPHWFIAQNNNWNIRKGYGF